MGPLRRLLYERLFPLLSGCLWVLFLFLDLSRSGDSTGVKFAAICLCCAAALLGAVTADGRLVAAALCFTVGADWFLLVTDRHYMVGIALFLLVQSIYAYRLYLIRGRCVSRSGLILRMAFFLLSLSMAFLPALLFRHWWEGPPRAALSQGFWPALTLFLPSFYFSNLLVNTIESFALGRAQRRFSTGLLLFVCCDICVGAWNLGLFPGFARVGMWFFYLPSQVLIVLSQNQERKSLDEKAL